MLAVIFIQQYTIGNELGDGVSSEKAFGNKQNMLYKQDKHQ